MTPTEGKLAKETYDNYRFNALLSVLTDEQREQFNTNMKQNLPDLKAKLVKFLAPDEAEDIISQIKKVDKFG